MLTHTGLHLDVMLKVYYLSVGGFNGTDIAIGIAARLRKHISHWLVNKSLHRLPH
jgi:hypothetical protein